MSYLIPMSIFNMLIQVFVVMSSYQSIAEKFKKTGNPRVSEIKENFNFDEASQRRIKASGANGKYSQPAGAEAV